MMLFFYAIPVILQLFSKYILKNRISILFLFNFFGELIIGIYHSNKIERELIEANSHCGMPLILPFFLTIIFETGLLIIFIIQTILHRKNVNKK